MKNAVRIQWLSDVAFYIALFSLITLVGSILFSVEPTIQQTWVHQLVLEVCSYLFPIASTIALVAVFFLKRMQLPPRAKRRVYVKHSITIILFVIAVLWVAGRITYLMLGPTD